MGLRRQKMNSSTFTRTLMPSAQRLFVDIPIFHHYSATRLARIETPTHILNRRKATLGQVASFTTSHRHNYLPMITTPKPTFVCPATPSGSQLAPNCRNAASESCNSRMDSHNCANGSGVLLQLRRRRISVQRFILTSSLDQLMNAYNFFHGCSKAHYHAVCPNPIQKHPSA
jgi:hypothetical protein